MDTGIFVVLSFRGRELVRDFGGEDGTKSLSIFSKCSAINEFGMPLPTTIWVGLAMYFSKHDELSRIYVRLKRQYFPLSLPLEASDVHR